MTQTAMPEWLQRKDREAGAWQVQAGQPVRGDAWTEMVGRVMRVPTGDDEVSRLIRAHEMMHARVSPFTSMSGKEFGVSDTVVTVAEEFRVNTLVGVAGFDLDNLRDGSEVNSGKRAGQSKDWNNAVIYAAALAGTKACADFIRGIRSEDKEMADAIREVEKAIVGKWTKIVRQNAPNNGRRGRNPVTPEAYRRAAKVIGDTDIYPESNLPYGFVKFTIPLARFIESILIHPDEEEVETPDQRFPDAEEVKEASKGVSFARMILDTDVVLSKRVDGRLGRRRVAANVGRNPRRMTRLLTDPERRIFDRTIKGKGGIVLIDQSGSMHLSEEDVWSIIEAAPGCTIIGYSHRPDSVDVPNVWVLADRGKVCDEVRPSNGGNGVDGPALKFAASKRRGGEAFIWVCDGYVTDSKDHFHDALASRCAKLVIKHGIHMVRDVAGAVEALQKAGSGRLVTRAIGKVADSVEWRQHARG